MLDHIGVQVVDVDGSAKVYLAALAPLGFQEMARFPSPDGLVVGIGDAGGAPYFWLSGVPDGRPGRETHLAFAAASRDLVDQVGRAAEAAGLEILHQPRLFPEYHPTYYGVFFRDLDGNNIEAVCHRPE